MNSSPSPALLRIEGVSKRFPGVQALSDVSFEVAEGEVHAIVGENGAGKSTLMKMLAGVYTPDAGEIYWRGKPLRLRTPADAQAHGISIIFQEFTLLPDLTVAENVLLNREPRTRLGLLDWDALNERTRALLALLDSNMDVQRSVASLSVAQQQIVEIVKALAFDARLLIMDEPTAALNPVEVESLFRVIERLKAQGSTIIFISHRLDEVLAISQRVTVLKDGRHVATQPGAGLTRESIVRQMIGRNLADIFPPKLAKTPPSVPLLDVHGLSTGRVRDVTFRVHPGEIVGIVGLEGHGQRELVRALFGLERITGGQVIIGGKTVRLKSPRIAVRAGIAFIPDDRKIEGLALKLNVRENVALSNLGAFNTLGIVQRKAEREAVGQMVNALGVRTPSLDQQVRLLSGGNQQKTVLAKWLIRQPRLFIFAEPTRGIDIGAKVEIYGLLHQLTAQGAGVIVVSSELIELLGLSHRILVMRDGELCAELDHTDANEESVMMAATGTTLQAAERQARESDKASGVQREMEQAIS